jgi:hypothetical protein
MPTLRRCEAMPSAVASASGVRPSGTSSVKLAGPASSRARSAASKPIDIAVLLATTRTFDLNAKALLLRFAT